MCVNVVSCICRAQKQFKGNNLVFFALRVARRVAVRDQIVGCAGRERENEIIVRLHTIINII